MRDDPSPGLPGRNLLGIDLDQRRLIEAAAAVRVRAAAHRELGNSILGELALGRPAGRAGVVCDDQADPADTLAALQLPQSDSGG